MPIYQSFNVDSWRGQQSKDSFFVAKNTGIDASTTLLEALIVA